MAALIVKYLYESVFISIRVSKDFFCKGYRSFYFYIEAGKQLIHHLCSCSTLDKGVTFLFSYLDLLLNGMY